MKFAIFYEHQLPRPWGESSEYELLENSLAQIELADQLSYEKHRLAAILMGDVASVSSARGLA